MTRFFSDLCSDRGRRRPARAVRRGAARAGRERARRGMSSNPPQSPISTPSARSTSAAISTRSSRAGGFRCSGSSSASRSATCSRSAARRSTARRRRSTSARRTARAATRRCRASPRTRTPSDASPAARRRSRRSRRRAACRRASCAPESRRGRSGPAWPRTAPNQLYAVSVQGDRRGEVSAATAAIAERIVDEVGGYARLKRETFQEQLASDNRQLEAIDRVVSQAASRLRQRLAGRAPASGHVAPDGGAAARSSRGEPAPDPAAARAGGAGRASQGPRPRRGDEDDGAEHAQLGGRCRPDRPHRRPSRGALLGADRGARRPRG